MMVLLDRRVFSLSNKEWLLSFNALHEWVPPIEHHTILCAVIYILIVPLLLLGRRLVKVVV